MKNFEVGVEELNLPKGATPRFRNVKISWRGKPITDLTQGLERAYLYPVYSPSGVPLTTESPVDHPHHNSITISADVFFVMLPPLIPKQSALIEEATYNFYVNATFQGRSPGRIWVTSFDAEEVSDDHLRIVQQVQWQGPEEWGAPPPLGRRVVAEETRTIDIRPGDVANVLDIRSQLRPTDWDVTIGPARHAYYTIRLEDQMRPINGGSLLDSEGRKTAGDITGAMADWVSMFGPAAHGKQAGITVIPHASAEGIPWIAFDFGSINVNPVQTEKIVLNRGDEFDLGIRILAHDGDPMEADVAGMYEAFKRESAPSVTTAS